jgi:cell division septal protein FtsQ
VFPENNEGSGESVVTSEEKFRRTARILIYLFLFYIPVVGLLGFGLGKLFDASWPLFTLAGIWMIGIIVVSAQRFVAYYRWKRETRG